MVMLRVMVKPKPAPEPETPKEVAWSIRMPGDLKRRIDAQAAALNARGKGRWSLNAMVVAMLTHAVDERDAGRGWEP